MNDAASVPVSVALATYNGAAFVDAQLDSLARQTAKPAELVVCDDQSTDDTVARIRAFAASAPFPVQVHVNDARLGWRANFLKAARLCASELIALCDQDDVWYPTKLATMSAAFDGPDIVLAHHGADLIDADGAVIGTMATSSFTRAVTPPGKRHTTWPNPFGLTIVFRRSLMRYVGLWPDPAHFYATDKPFPHDQWLFNFAIHVGTVRWIDERLVGYRQHGGNAIGWSDRTPAVDAASDSAEIVARIDAGLRVLRPFTRAFKCAAAIAPEPDSARLRKAVRLNGMLRSRFELRRTLHTGSLVVRVAALAAMLATGAYKGGRGWTLGKRALVDDIRAAFVRRIGRRVAT